MKKTSFKERIVENFKKNKLILLAFLVVWTVVVFGTVNFYKDTLGKESVGNEMSENYVELHKQTKVEETIPVSEIENCDSVCIKFATYMRKNEGEVNVLVYGKTTGRIYASADVNVKNLQDNAFYTISLNKKLDSEVDKYIALSLTSNSEEGKGVATYYSNLKCFENSILSINNVNNNGDLTVRFLKQNDNLMMFNNSIIIWMSGSVLFLIVLLVLVQPKLEIIFACMAALFGLTFMIVITPMSVPDETVHYEYAFQLSNYITREDNHLIFDEEYQNYGSFSGHHNISAAYTRLVEKIDRPLNLRDRDVVMRIDIDESYTTCFVPQALGITLARLLKLNMLKTFYLGRLFNLVFYVLCVYIAIKRTPIHKMLFGVLATLPIFMQQAASYSYDCWINGLTFVVISSFLKWMYGEETIDKKEIIFVLFANILLAPIKVVYSLFMLLFVFVPTRRFASKKQRMFVTLLVMFPAIYELTKLLFPLAEKIVDQIITNLTAANHVGNEFATMSIDTGAKPYYEGGDVFSFSHVLRNPWEAVMIFVRTIRVYIKTWFYGSFGRTLSGDTLVLPLWLVHSILGVAFLSAFRKEDFVETISMKIAYVGLCVFGALMMLGGMLISWTEYNQDIIDAFGGIVIQGIQGRYFSPLLPYFMSIFNNRKITVSKKMDKYILFALFILIFETVVYVLSYTFVN